MGSSDDELYGYGQDRRYSEWTWPDVMVYGLDMGRRSGVLTGHGQ